MKADLEFFIKEKLFQLRPHVMKKILLGVTGMRAEMRRGEVAQFLFAHTAARKVKLPQRALYPHVHRKRSIKAVGEQQNTIGDFPPDAAKLHQLRARIRERQESDFLQIQCLTGNLPRGGKQMRRAKTHFAGAQFGFSRRDDFFRQGK